MDWPELAKEILDLAVPRRVLVIVNIKRHAVALLEALGDAAHTHHLSTSMCPAHRKNVLATVKRDLAGNGECVLVATQCVEAGVDLDFPLVYRALAPLDSIAQAAGRCNRHGNASSGEVRVFRPCDGALPRDEGYKLGTTIVESLLSASHGQLDPNHPELFGQYYRKLYALSDLPNRKEELLDAVKAHNFPEVARLYRLIDDNTSQMVVPYLPQVFAELQAGLQETGFNAKWIRRAREYTVNVFQNTDNIPGSIGVPIRNRAGDSIPGWYMLGDPRNYDIDKLGLVLPRKGDFLNA